MPTISFMNWTPCVWLQPRSEYPLHFPARLRIGPDWLAYAGNWMTEWERTGNTKYRDKIIAGMKSISALPNRLLPDRKHSDSIRQQVLSLPNVTLNWKRPII